MGERNLKTYETLGDRVEKLAQRYQFVSSLRSSQLFTHFLVTGYKQTTLSSVSDELNDTVIYAKVCLGMIITLYDDLADNPSVFNPELLQKLYRLSINERPIRPDMNVNDQRIYELAVFLFDELKDEITKLPRSKDFKTVLSFDIKQIFLANQYSELMTDRPHIRNMTESKFYGPYNMGMVAAGMIDLMGSPDFDMQRTGDVRQVLIQGQRLGRIGNLLTTFSREEAEGDLTNEMLLHQDGPEAARNELLAEFYEKLARLMNDKRSIGAIDIFSYAEGLSSLFDLHKNMKGII